jgi:DNA-binding transcriptional regulator/RsmH inhibitor MraZ
LIGEKFYPWISLKTRQLGEDDMKRREFLKAGLSSLALFLVKGAFYQFSWEELVTLEPVDQQEFLFRGKFNERIERGFVSIPEYFRSGLMNKEIHLVVVDGCCLTLIPGGKSKKKRIEEEIEEKKRVEPEMSISHWGVTRLRRRGKGKLFLPEEALKMSRIPSTGNVVVAGMLSSIEIWDEKRWDEEIRKYMEENEDLFDSIEKVMA